MRHLRRVAGLDRAAAPVAAAAGRAGEETAPAGARARVDRSATGVGGPAGPTARAPITWWALAGRSVWTVTHRTSGEAVPPFGRARRGVGRSAGRRIHGRARGP